jgi:urease accessory protein
MFALACVEWRIPLFEAACGLAWSWCQNQVAAAIRLVPLGQTAGQRILQESIVQIPAVVEEALALADRDIGFTAPGLALASARHERQYTRLFLS